MDAGVVTGTVVPVPDVYVPGGDAQSYEDVAAAVVHILTTGPDAYNRQIVGFGVKTAK